MFFRRRKHEIEGDTLDELLETAGLSDRYEALQEEELPAVWVRSTAADDSEIAVGASKFGGSPDMPDGIVWPENDGRPLMFLAQIRLEDVRGIPGAEVLPARGHLLFFYDEEQPWGFSPEHAAGTRVIFIEDTSLHRVPPPAGTARMPVCSLSFAPKTTIPDVMSMEVEELVLSNVEGDDYVEMSEVYARRYPGPEHQMLGHPVLVQGEMRWQCAMVSQGIDVGGPRVEITEEAVAEGPLWRLLLQLDSDNDAGMMWGDAGLLYFWIHEDDLANREFGKVRTVLQCT